MCLFGDVVVICSVFYARIHYKYRYELVEIHHKETTTSKSGEIYIETATKPPQNRHKFSTTSPHLESPQPVVFFVVFYTVAKFTT